MEDPTGTFEEPLFETRPMWIDDTKQYKGKHVLILGLGRYPLGSGRSAARFLLGCGARLLVSDQKTPAELHEAVAAISSEYQKRKDGGEGVYEPQFHFGTQEVTLLDGIDVVLRNPGVPVQSPLLQEAQKRGIPIETDVSLFFRLCPFPLVAVTGTRGKSTTTAWIGSMMERASGNVVVAGNNQRSPLNDLPLLLASHTAIPVVLEMSSWMTESLQKDTPTAQVAVFTNLYPDHLDRYASLKEYRDAKAVLFLHQRPSDVAVLSFDHPLVAELSKQVASQVVWTSLQPLPAPKEGVFVDQGVIYYRHAQGKEEEIVRTEELSLKGQHNVANALSAIAAASAFGIPLEAIRFGLTHFSGLSGRQEPVAEVKGVLYVNDTTATTTEGVLAALDRFASEGKRIVLITGGTSKGLAYEALGKRIGEVCRKVVFLTGSATKEMRLFVPPKYIATEATTMREAVQAAASLASEGEVVLLSPGASSFEGFKNEFDRGEQFVQAVRELSDS